LEFVSRDFPDDLGPTAGVSLSDDSNADPEIGKDSFYLTTR